MARYGKSLAQAWREELDKLKGQLASQAEIKAAKRALHKDAADLHAADKATLDRVLSSNPVLAKLYAMRQELAALWDRSTATSEQLLKDLQDWCARAEASGIRALEEFSLRLRSYALPAVAVAR